MITQIINQTLEMWFTLIGCCCAIAYATELIDKAIRQIKNDRFYKQVRGL